MALEPANTWDGVFRGFCPCLALPKICGLRTRTPPQSKHSQGHPFFMQMNSARLPGCPAGIHGAGPSPWVFSVEEELEPGPWLGALRASHRAGWDPPGDGNVNIVSHSLSSAPRLRHHTGPPRRPSVPVTPTPRFCCCQRSPGAQDGLQLHVEEVAMKPGCPAAFPRC